MRRRLVPVVMTILVPFVLTACGGDDGEGGSDEAKPYVDEMSQALTGEDSPMDDEQADCFSEGFIDVVGLDKVKEAGSAEEVGQLASDFDFSSMDLTEDQGNEIYDNFDECGVDLRQQLLDDLDADNQMPEEGKECVTDALSEDVLRDFFVTGMVDGQEASLADTELTQALLECQSAMTPAPE